MSTPVLRLVGTPVKVRDDVPTAVSEAYVESHPDASAYHRPIWLDIVKAAFGHDTKYLVAERDDRVVGVLPLVFFRSRLFGRFAVSMPFFNYGGILADDIEAERQLLERAIAETQAAGGSHLELRHVRQHFAELTPRKHKVAMELALAPDAEQQWSALDRKIRNQVRKAEKSGLQAEEGGVELLPAFYEVFAHNMRDLGTPVYSRKLFREVLTRVPDASRLCVVRSEGRPVAASLVHWHGATIEVPWASALRAFNPMCANVFLYWHMVRAAIGRGMRTFDFGRSTPDEGTFHYKKQWGAEPRPLVWEYWTAKGNAVPQMNPGNPKFDLAIRTWQRLPIRVATALGPLVVRNIP
jgi:serine/alanine adding enzyme